MACCGLTCALAKCTAVLRILSVVLAVTTVMPWQLASQPLSLCCSAGQRKQSSVQPQTVSTCCADQPGRWLFRCNVEDHNTAGMKGVLAIIPRNGQLNSSAPVMSR